MVIYDVNSPQFKRYLSQCKIPRPPPIEFLLTTGVFDRTTRGGPTSLLFTLLEDGTLACKDRTVRAVHDALLQGIEKKYQRPSSHMENLLRELNNSGGQCAIAEYRGMLMRFSTSHHHDKPSFCVGVDRCGVQRIFFSHQGLFATQVTSECAQELKNQNLPTINSLRVPELDLVLNWKCGKSRTCSCCLSATGR
jgi:hypothetical protein